MKRMVMILIALVTVCGVKAQPLQPLNEGINKVYLDVIENERAGWTEECSTLGAKFVETEWSGVPFERGNIPPNCVEFFNDILNTPKDKIEERYNRSL